MFSRSPRQRACLSATHWFACIATAVAVTFVTEQTASAQNRDPQAVFEYAEQLEERGVDTHFGPSVIDRIFDPLKCWDEKMETAGLPLEKQ